MTDKIDSDAAPRRNAYREALRVVRPALITAGAFSAIVNVLMLTGSIYMLQVYDRVLGSGSIPTLVGLFTVVVMLYGFLGYYEFLRSRILARAATRLDRKLGATVFRSWLRAGTEANAGERAEAQPLRDLDQVRGFMGSPAISGVFDLPWMPLYLGVLFLIHPWVGWLTIAGALVVTGLAWINRVVMAPALMRSGKLDQAEKKFADRSQQMAGTLLPMGMEGAITARWRGLHDALIAGSQAGSDASEALASASRAFRMLLQSSILTLGALLVLRGEISGGMIIASTILAGRALAPLDQVIGQWRSIGKAAESHRRLDAFFEGEVIAAENRKVDLPRPTGKIEVNRLTKYAPGRKAGAEKASILSQVSFALEPGDGLGVVGNSASGKSTLARVLVGAWSADAGEVRLDGATRDQWDPEDLGRSIGYLPQNVELLPGTVRDNIARFDPDAKSAQVIEAAKVAGIHEMILGLPDGYATKVGGPDTPLSGGQVQRLGLARAVYGMPSIVVLDEPNSNLDASGDAALNHAITTLREAGSTVIVMAHRPSALAALNKVLVLQSGSVAKFGTKESVLGAANAEAIAQAANVASRTDGPGAANAGLTGAARGAKSAGGNRYRVFTTWRD